MNNAGRGNWSPVLNCSFVKRITFFPPFSVGIAASSFTKSINTSWGMRNRSRNSFAFNLSIAFSLASLTRTDETAFFGAIFYHKAKSKSTYKSSTTNQTKQSENPQTLTQNSQKNPSKTPPNNNKVPTFNNNCKRLVQNNAQASQKTNLKSQQTQPKEWQQQRGTYQIKHRRRRTGTASIQNHQQQTNKVAIQKHRYKRAFEVCLREAKDAGKSNKKKGSQENAVGKIAKRGTVPYL